MKYPPVFQAIGSEDEAFDVLQIVSFDEQLSQTGIESRMVIVDGMGHSSDMKANIGGEIHKFVIVPAVTFAEECLKRTCCVTGQELRQ